MHKPANSTTIGIEPIATKMMPTVVTRLPFVLAGATGACLFIAWGGLQLMQIQPILNFTVSAPRGVYLVKRFDGRAAMRGEYVRFDVPREFHAYVYGRGWLPLGTPLLKPVGGIAGDIACFADGQMTVNGVDAVRVAKLDRQGLRLPALDGCIKVEAGQFLPLSVHHSNSFDGRYMGPISLSMVTGRARLLWTF